MKNVLHIILIYFLMSTDLFASNTLKPGVIITPNEYSEILIGEKSNTGFKKKLKIRNFVLLSMCLISLTNISCARNFEPPFVGVEEEQNDGVFKRPESFEPPFVGVEEEQNDGVFKRPETK